jgi:hypothetical protein
MSAAEQAPGRVRVAELRDSAIPPVGKQSRAPQFSFSITTEALTLVCEPPARVWRPTAAAEV